MLPLCRVVFPHELVMGAWGGEPNACSPFASVVLVLGTSSWQHPASGWGLNSGKGWQQCPVLKHREKADPRGTFDGAVLPARSGQIVCFEDQDLRQHSVSGTLNCVMLSADQADNIKPITSLCVSSHQACVMLLGGNKRVIFLVFRGYEATSRSHHLASCASWRACWQPYSQGTELVQVNLSTSSTVAAGPCLPDCVSLTQWLGNPGC